MIDIVEIHMVPNGSHLEHIDKLKWVKVNSPGDIPATKPAENTRAEMYAYVKANPKQAFAISQNDRRWAYLEAVNGHVQYVRTMPDSTKADNLLTLPRY